MLVIIWKPRKVIETHLLSSLNLLQDGFISPRLFSTWIFLGRFPLRKNTSVVGRHVLINHMAWPVSYQECGQEEMLPYWGGVSEKQEATEKGSRERVEDSTAKCDFSIGYPGVGGGVLTKTPHAGSAGEESPGFESGVWGPVYLNHQRAIDPDDRFQLIINKCNIRELNTEWQALLPYELELSICFRLYHSLFKRSVDARISSWFRLRGEAGV